MHATLQKFLFADNDQMEQSIWRRIELSHDSKNNWEERLHNKETPRNGICFLKNLLLS